MTKKTETPESFEMPPPSDWLDDEAKRQYTLAASLLSRSGTVRPADAPLLEVYAQAMSDYITLTESLRKSGNTITGAHGGEVVHPNATLRAIAHRQVLSACAKLGMSPTDKSRAKREPQKAKNPFLQ